MRIIYLGTPEFAVPTLERLIKWPFAEVVGLVTQPDRPAGRGRKVGMPPTKMVAENQGIPVFQPVKLSKAPDIVEAMRALKPDVLVMVAFGQILRKEVLEMAPHGVVNLHGSLLPKYRGPAPINWAIIEGQTMTGVTTMLSDRGVDTGPMLLRKEIPIAPETDAETLARDMSVIGADLILETLSQLNHGQLVPQAQDDSQATHAPLLTRDMAIIDWAMPASELHNRVRGLVPWPGTYTHYEGVLLKITRTTPVPSQADGDLAPGTIASFADAVIVACGPGGRDRLEILEVQPANRARMSARDWANGVRLRFGLVLGQ